MADDQSPENNPTLAAHAKAAEFGHNLSSTAAAYIAEAVLAASGLRAADRRAAPDRETLAQLLHNVEFDIEPVSQSIHLDRFLAYADALLASGVLGVPADPDRFTVHVTFDTDATDLIRAEGVEAFAATWSNDPADADEYEVRQHALKFAADLRKAAGA